MKHFIPLHGALLPQTASVGSSVCQKGFTHLLLTLIKRLKSAAEGPSSALAYTSEEPGELRRGGLLHWAQAASLRDFSLSELKSS